MNTTMNSEAGSERTLVNDRAERNAAMDEAVRAPQMDAAPTNPRVARKETPKDEPKRSAIPMGSDNPTPKPKKDGEPRLESEQLAPLFAPNVATDYRAQWVVVQQGFVDDPHRAVQQGDELVTQVMRNLAETFSKERTALEGQLGDSDKASTEMLRVALRRYRSFFERLLSF